MEDKSSDIQDTDSPVKAWLEDNLRVLMSILIVVAIAGGIYSYSNRSQSPTISDETQESQDSLLEKLATDQENVMTKEDSQGSQTEEKKDSAASQDKQIVSTPADTSKETENSFIESAQRGDGTTHLARRALANYLEKNPDSALTVEHKIYIEDFLRKNVKHSGQVHVGTSVEFSKDMIRGAIEKSKQLNDKQLQNLKKYSARAPSLK